MDFNTVFEKTLNDKDFWNLLTTEIDKKFLIEIEIARKNKYFNHCNFQEFINYLDNQNNTEK